MQTQRGVLNLPFRPNLLSTTGCRRRNVWAIETEPEVVGVEKLRQNESKLIFCLRLTAPPGGQATVVYGCSDGICVRFCLRSEWGSVHIIWASAVSYTVSEWVSQSVFMCVLKHAILSAAASCSIPKLLQVRDAVKMDESPGDYQDVEQLVGVELWQKEKYTQQQWVGRHTNHNILITCVCLTLTQMSHLPGKNLSGMRAAYKQAPVM